MLSVVGMPSIFLGVTPTPVRRYLATVLGPASARYDRIVLPCCGRYSGTMVALKAGFKPETVFTSDISLFSGLIGLLAAGKDPRELGAVVNMPELPDLQALANDTADPVDHAAAVLVALKIATTKGKNAFANMFVTDLRGDWRRHHDVVKAHLTKLVDQLRGINYKPADLFEEVKAAADDPRAVVFLAPPDVSGGYVKMFDSGGKVTFKQPEIANFDPKGGFEKLAEITGPARALVLTLRPYDDRKNDKHPDAVFASLTGLRMHVLLANRKEEALGLGKARGNTAGPRKTPKYPVWGGIKDVLRPESVVTMTTTKTEIGLYYRDLFAHRMGQTSTEGYFLAWLDGKVFATIGMYLTYVKIGRPYIAGDPRLLAFQSFAMGPSHPRYKYISRLVNMLCTCEEFLTVLKKSTNFPMGDPAGVITRCITKAPEAKHNRGIMKLVSREKREDGQYLLTYTADWRPGTFSDQVRQWLVKYGTTKETTDGDEKRQEERLPGE